MNQFRHPFAARTATFPAGRVDAGEAPENAAARELEEEAGYKCAKLTKLAIVHEVPEFARCVGHVYLAEGLEATAALREDGEATMTVEICTNAERKSCPRARASLRPSSRRRSRSDAAKMISKAVFVSPGLFSPSEYVRAAAAASPRLALRTAPAGTRSEVRRRLRTGEQKSVTFTAAFFHLEDARPETTRWARVVAAVAFVGVAALALRRR